MQDSLWYLCVFPLNQLLGEMPAALPVAEATRSLQMPRVGDWLRFRYPPADGRRFKHCFYDDFPNGRKVRATESRVSLHADIQCLEVRENWILFHELALHKIRRGYFIAVRFVNDDGVELWTNFSRDDHAWLLPSEDSD